ncbi:MAG: ABC transporter ATP-binding protein [candidate division Zixibacteria bacterium]|nr:ABC transporter ATP-binding protein [candidate division Zixibacteria bacterium]
MDKESFIVEVENLVRKFDGFTAVDNITFQVRKGEVFGFLGPNGAGKTTTIKMLCGLLSPTSGRGRVGDYDISTQSEKIKENIGYMSQKFSLYEELTVEENIDFYSGIYRVKKVLKKERKEWVLKMADLEDKRGRKTGELALGWKQRLALGCALLHNPPILFLDEPTSGVDPVSRRNFWDMIYSFSDKGTTVFVTTHYLDEAEYCHRLGLIFKGKLVQIGTPEELKGKSVSGSIWELECDKPIEALDFLQKDKRIMEVSLFGINIHLLLPSGEEVTPFSHLLKEKGIEVIRLHKVIPSLEDAFVSLIRKES